MFRIIVEEITLHAVDQDNGTSIELYRQTVDAIDLPAVMAAVNPNPPIKPPRKRRKVKEPAA